MYYSSFKHLSYTAGTGAKLIHDIVVNQPDILAWICYQQSADTALSCVPHRVVND